MACAPELCKAQMTPPSGVENNKVTIIGGAGQTAIACAHKILSQANYDDEDDQMKLMRATHNKKGTAIYWNFWQREYVDHSTDRATHFNGLVREVALIDVHRNVDKLRAEVMDLQLGITCYKDVKIIGGTEYCLAAGSKICIVATGVRQKPGDCELNPLRRSVNIYREIIPKIVSVCPNAILIIATHPVDHMTYVAWKLSCLPKHRVIGYGTQVITSRFRFLLSQRINVSPECCTAWVIGVQNCPVPVWSGVAVGGEQLRSVNPRIGTSCDTEKWNGILDEIKTSSEEIIRSKGSTAWGIGVCLAKLIEAIVTNSSKIFTVSTMAQGYYDIGEEVFMSLPCVLADLGVTYIINQSLDSREKCELRTAAASVAEVLDEICL